MQGIVIRFSLYLYLLIYNSLGLFFLTTTIDSLNELIKSITIVVNSFGALVSAIILVVQIFKKSKNKKSKSDAE